MYVAYKELTLRSKYGAKIKGPVTKNMLEKILALGPNHRILVTGVLRLQYFISDPKYPLKPEEMVFIHEGGDGNLHEF